MIYAIDYIISYKYLISNINMNGRIVGAAVWELEQYFLFDFFITNKIKNEITFKKLHKFHFFQISFKILRFYIELYCYINCDNE